MNGITIGDEVQEDEMGPQDGDESNEENGENEIPSEDESNSRTITKTEFLIAVPLNRRGKCDLKYCYDLRLANS